MKALVTVTTLLGFQHRVFVTVATTSSISFEPRVCLVARYGSARDGA
jgi:hypothetical protein